MIVYAICVAVLGLLVYWCLKDTSAALPAQILGAEDYLKGSAPMPPAPFLGGVVV